MLQLVPKGARVLDLGSGLGAVGAALKEKNCTVVGCDIEEGISTPVFDKFFLVDLNRGLPEMPGERFDVILALDVIEHLAALEDFLDQLRALAARSGARVILTTANIGFIVMRISLLLGRFERQARYPGHHAHTAVYIQYLAPGNLRAAGFEIERPYRMRAHN